MKCCDYNAGMLKEPLTFQRVTRASDSAGGFTEAWAKIVGSPERGHVRSASGGERFGADRVEGTARLRVTVRYTDKISERDAVLIRGVRHNIRFINNVEFADKWLEIDVERGVAT